jgi:solute carrier family 25 (mitochondrial aspartate/glutamate transporter), member 12/13
MKHVRRPLPNRSSNSDSPNHSPKTSFKSVQDQELIRTALLKSSFFSCMDDEQFNTFIQSVEIKQYAPGQIIILEGCSDLNNSPSDGSNSQHDNETSNAHLYSVDAGAFCNEQFSSTRDEITAMDDHTLVEAMDDGSDSAQQEFRENDSTTGTLSEKESGTSNLPQDRRIDDFNRSSIDDSTGRQSSESGNDDVAKSLMVNQRITASCLDSSTATLSAPVLSTLSEIVKPPLPPQSGNPRAIYIIRKGHAEVYYQKPNGPENQPYKNSYPVNTIGPGTLFGEGGFLFGRQHSASIVASTTSDLQSQEPLECWVMDIHTFRDYVLPSSMLRQIFKKYARTSKDCPDEEAFMTMDDFLEAIKEYQHVETTGESSYFNLATSLHDSLIRLRLIERFHDHNVLSEKEQEPKLHLNDFCFFFLLIARPDPEVDVAFLLMDENQTGQIGLHDLEAFLQPMFPKLDFQSHFFQRYFGVAGDQCIRSASFSQFLMDLQREIGQQAYIQAVQEFSVELGASRGYLSPDDFVDILTLSCGWRLPPGIVSRLKDVYCCNNLVQVPTGSQDVSSKDYVQQKELETTPLGDSIDVQAHPLIGEHYFSYGDFIAFQEVLGNLPFLCNLVHRVETLKGGPISADDFKVANRMLGLSGRVSRRQVEILFHLFDLDHDGYISRDDTVKVCGINFSTPLISVTGRDEELQSDPPHRRELKETQSPSDPPVDLVHKVSLGAFHFGIAMIVGGFSVGVLHPFELIKTRLMNQRFGHALRYRGSFDCMKQVIRKEGWLSLFRGVQPQILGVAMERSIKLQVHHLLQQSFHFRDEDKDDHSVREPSLWLEAVAGGCAGACQLLVTNPMEITSIRLQMQGETAQLLMQKGIVPPAPFNLWGVVKDLGFPGVYRGASACLLRDIPFSAIYFPAYMACKDALVANTYDGKLSPSEVLLAGTIAGIPAALLTSPADVVKCRLQSTARPGEASYAGIQDCAMKIYLQEGINAFFRGSLMRVLRIAPQFGLSLMLYEGLVSNVGFEKARHPPTNLPIDPKDYFVAFPRRYNNAGLFRGWSQNKEDQ